MIRRKVVLSYVAATAATIAIVAASCGKKSDDDTAAAADTNPVATNPAALAYPTSLAISAFPSSTSTTLTDTLLADVDPTDATPAAKKDEQEKLLRGEADSCLPKVMAQADKAGDDNNCYEFDQDMIYGTRSTTYYGTRDGKDSKGEACLIGFSRAKVKQVVGHVDRSLALAQIALCQRKKTDGAAGTTQPAIGEDIDLAPHLKTAFGKKGENVTSAKLTRLADASDGAKVFSMSFDLTRPDGVAMVVNIIHSPRNDANTSYTGVMNAKITEAGQTKKRFVSVMYDRSDTLMKYNLRSANFVSTNESLAIGADGQVDFNAGTTAGNFPGESNQYIDRIMSVAFEGNPVTNAGTFAYWQNPGGNYTERARGMLASLTYDAATKTLSGCAVSGAAGTASDGLSIRKAIATNATLEPNGAYHPFFNVSAATNQCGATSAIQTEGTYTFYTKTCTQPTASTSKWYIPAGTNASAFVTQQHPEFHTKQCFKQNTSGVYEIDTALTPSADGYELIAAATKAVTPPKAPTPGTGVKKQ